MAANCNVATFYGGYNQCLLPIPEATLLGFCSANSVAPDQNGPLWPLSSKVKNQDESLLKWKIHSLICVNISLKRLSRKNDKILAEEAS